MLRWYNVVVFLPGGLLVPREPSEHKVYILHEKRGKKNHDNNVSAFVNGLTVFFFYIIDHLFLIWIQRF